MKQVTEPSTMLYYYGKLMEVIGINEGHRSLHLRFVREQDKPRCTHCGASIDTTIDVIEGSLNFQTGAEPVPTIHDVERR